MTRLTSFQYTLLAAIVDLDKPSGQEVRRYLEDHDSSNVDTVNHGRLYPNLDALVESSLVKKSYSDQRTNAYVPKDKGVEMLERRTGFLTPNE